MHLKLKTMRVSRCLRQEDVAKALGIGTPAYNRKELGMVPFKVDEAIIMLKLFGCKFEDIFLVEDATK
jgi:DNA-binding XRE family transcriptional regulator